MAGGEGEGESTPCVPAAVPHRAWRPGNAPARALTRLSPCGDSAERHGTLSARHDRDQDHGTWDTADQRPGRGTGDAVRRDAQSRVGRKLSFISRFPTIEDPIVVGLGSSRAVRVRVENFNIRMYGVKRTKIRSLEVPAAVTASYRHLGPRLARVRVASRPRTASSIPRPSSNV